MLVVAAAVGGGAFVLVSVVVGVRLLALARRTRQLPELAIGAGLVLLAGIGYPLLTAALALGEAPRLQAALVAGSGVASVLGQSGIALFNWRAFRPGELWPALLTASVVAGLGALWLAQALGPGWSSFARTQEGPWAVQAWTSLLTMGWGGTESFAYYRKLRRRLALGLADALVTDRLRLWSVAMSAALLSTAIAGVLRAAGVQMTGEVTGLFVGPLGVVSATAMWLAFLPPQRYVNWVLARAGAGA